MGKYSSDYSEVYYEAVLRLHHMCRYSIYPVSLQFKCVDKLLYTLESVGKITEITSAFRALNYCYYKM